MWLHRPIPILTSFYQAQTYSPLLPRHQPQIVLPNALPDEVRGLPPPRGGAAPARFLLVQSEEQSAPAGRNLGGVILPRVPNATLEIYGVMSVPLGKDGWSSWQGSYLPTGMSDAVKKSIRIHPPANRQELIAAMPSARVMPYLGHKAEAFCILAAEAQALGLPGVFAPLNVLPERVIDGVTGFIRADGEGFAEKSVELLIDDDLWRLQLEARFAISK